MDLTIYDIIRSPIVTEKASYLINDLKKVVLLVHMQANKRLVKEALEKLFNVKVKDVNIIIRKGKNRKFKRFEITGSASKRAIVTLKDAESFDILTKSGAGAIPMETMPGNTTEVTSLE